jgi:hypothetical protein
MNQLFLNESGIKDSSGNYQVFPWGGLCIDEKGTYLNTLENMAQRYQRKNDLVILSTRPESDHTWKPTVRFNLLSDDSITASTYANAILKTADSISGSCEDKGFFRTQAQTHILKAIELLKAIQNAQLSANITANEIIHPSLDFVHNILCDEQEFNSLLTQNGVFNNEISSTHPLNINPTNSRSYLKCDKIKQCVQHFEKNYWSQPKDQLAGVQGTIHNYLAYFINNDVAEVFCRDSTFNFNELDKGKIICVTMPHKLAIERRYICTFLKILFYAHVLSRFSKANVSHPLHKCNLLVCWQDEAQRFIIEEDGDVDVIREANATTVIACQSKTSLIPPLKTKDKANVTILNLRNRLIFRASDLECAQSSSDFLGKTKKVKKSISKGNGKTTYNYNDEIQHKIEPHELMQLPEFTAVVCHAESRFKKYVIRPTSPTGNTPHWWYATLRKISLPKYLKQLVFPQNSVF